MNTNKTQSPGSLHPVVRPRTRHCEACQHRIWSEEYANTPKALQCAKGHAPRFYNPTSPIDQEWGWKRKCHDYEVGEHVHKITTYKLEWPND